MILQILEMYFNSTFPESYSFIFIIFSFLNELC